ncbi:aspartate/glutamate racemase family protein [uncultured Kiloniella sp.]|uniref:aspartate/glutamate racemase family protein n=1 Tax=uncultured Kiloniella sp. TaxID=1133091 RepID=UPI002632F6E9|nr:aspartate/glutamate racemase family protein [uncultured Kiloniella sp.]
MPHCQKPSPLAIGVLMLDTEFERIKGDIGNPNTFDFPVIFKTIKSATADKVVTNANKARDLLPLFIQGAQELEKQGVKAIATSCGFLTIVQSELTEAVSVPVVTSSLLLIPLISTVLGSKRKIGIITADSNSLSAQHLLAIGIDDRFPVHIKGLENSRVFVDSILSPNANCRLDPQKIEQDLLDLAESFCQNHPAIGVIILECTNLQPYAHNLRRKINRPVYGIVDLINFINKGLP